jgi:hypothetical protein
MLIKRHFVFVLISLTLTLQLAVARSSPAQSAPSVQEERWVIFPAERASEQGIGDWFVEDGQTAEYWTPSESDKI